MPIRTWAVQVELLTENGGLVGWASGQLRCSGDGSWGGELQTPFGANSRRWPTGAIILRVLPGKQRSRAMLYPSVEVQGDWPDAINTSVQTATFEGIGGSPLV
jgi:hypothetical protein